MIKTFSYITIILILASCNNNRQSVSEEPVPLYPAPQTFALNTEEGYKINTVTGDSIQPLINSLGDTIKTGRPVPAIGKVIHPDSIAQPKIIPLGRPKVIPAHLNVHKIPETLTVIPVNKELLKTFTPGVDSSSFVLVNSFGDTIPTGVPIPVKGKIVPCLQPQPVKALPPHYKDNASINIKYLDVDQGIDPYVISILEDSRGNLWFGTWGGGVSRYDGKTFTHFTEKEGLSHNRVYSILEDRQGNIWFGTMGGGVCMYNGETFIHFTEKEGLSHRVVWCILEDSHGNLWFGTNGGGVTRYDGRTFTHFTEKEGLSNNRVRSILEDSHGNFWFGTRGGGVSRYDGKTFTHFTKKDGLSSNYVRSILEDSQGNLWFGTFGGGLSMFNGKTFTHFIEKKDLNNNVIFSILEDSRGNLWFGTQAGGVIKYNGVSFTHYTEKEGLSNNEVRSILEDSHGNLWFGTWGGGVNIYSDETFIHFTEKEGLSSDIVWSILEDSRGNLWFGTRSRGAIKYNGKSFMHITLEKRFSNRELLCILEDSRGNLWFGMTGGVVVVYNGKTIMRYTKKEGLSSNYVYSILEDSQGNLWFGTWGGGLSMFNGKTFTHFTEREGLYNKDVWYILEDKESNLWFATESGGVIKYNDGSFTHFTEREGLSNNKLNTIFEDSQGNLWFGTEGGGVSMFNGKTFTHFTEREGLSSNIVWSIIEDQNSNIWLSTEKGLNHLVFDPDSDFNIRNSLSTSSVNADHINVAYKNPVIYTYDLQDGLKAMDFNMNSALLDSKNRLWWGSGKGVIMLDMNNFKIPIEPPTNMQLNRVDINERFVDYHNLNDSARKEIEFSGVPKFYNYPLDLNLPYSHNHLTLYFSAIDWSAPHKIRYSYKMEGLTDSWSALTAEAKADYRSLPHGTYTFKVRAIGAAQKWSEPFEYAFTILPPWWLTWWARISYAGILIFLVFFVIHKRTENLKRRQVELETEVEKSTTLLHEQNQKLDAQNIELDAQNIELDAQNNELNIQRQLVEEADRLKSEFLSNMSHEIRTPLNSIMALSTVLINQTKDKLSDEEINYLEIVERNGKELLELINNILDLSKIEAGRMDVMAGKVSIANMLGMIKESLAILAVDKGVALNLKIPKNQPMIETDESRLHQVFMNVAGNAVKFTEKGSIDIIVRSDTKNIYVDIKDTGIGISEEELPHIFDEFRQVDGSAAREFEGTGLGLAIAYKTMKLLYGAIRVKSELGKGSVFTITIPLKWPGIIEEAFEDKKSIPKPTKQKNKTIFKTRLPKVLVVEDNPDNMVTIKAILKDKYEIIEAYDGKDGLKQAKEQSPDIILLDKTLPKMDGIEVVKIMKKDDETKNIPVIALTASAMKEDEELFLKAGCDDFITKPIDQKILFNKLNEWLGT